MQSKSEMEAFVTGLLKNNLPFYYYYHNYEHTLYVMEKAVEIARQENCTPDEIELVRTGALWHDTGCINRHAGHEEEGCILASKYMPEYGYSTGEINKVCGMIMATKIPQSPENKLEEIVADADLEYLGTENAALKAANLFKELNYMNPGLTKEEWNLIQISFLQQHHYFTPFCKENRTPAKLEYLNTLLKSTS